MAPVVYVLCALASLACSALLVRGWARSRSRFLFWASLCFAGLALSNVLLVIDLVMLPQVDLLTCRQLVTLAALVVLTWGFIWDAR